MSRRGRRPGVSHAREDILQAARARFAADGYAGATLRSIAADAKVDPALIHHYFGTKQGLFVQALALPFEPGKLVEGVATGPHDEAGRRLLQTFLGIWDPSDRRLLIAGLLRAAATEEGAARMLREFLIEAIYRPVVTQVARDQIELRSALLGSQLVGLAFMRYVAEMEPLASMQADQVIDAHAAAIQHTLVGTL